MFLYMRFCACLIESKSRESVRVLNSLEISLDADSIDSFTFSESAIFTSFPSSLLILGMKIEFSGLEVGP